MKTNDQLIQELTNQRKTNNLDEYDVILSKIMERVNQNELSRKEVWKVLGQEGGNLRYLMTPLSIKIKNGIKNREAHQLLLEYPFGIMLESGYYQVNNGF